jgi:hypothetical protein
VRRPFVRDPPQTGGRLTHDRRGRVSSGPAQPRFGVDATSRCEQARPAGVRREASSGGGGEGQPRRRPHRRKRQVPSAVAVPRAMDRGRVDQVGQSVYASPELLGAARVIAIVVSGKLPSPSTPGARPRTSCWPGGTRGSSPVRTESRTRRGWAELLGLKADEQGYGTCSRRHPADAGAPQARPSGECPPTRCAGPPRCSSRSVSRSRKSRSRSSRARRQLHKVWCPDGRRGPQVRAAPRAQARGRPARAAQPRDVRALEPDQRPDYLGRSTGCAAPGAADLNVGARRGAGLPARQAGCPSACSSCGRPRRGAF